MLPGQPKHVGFTYNSDTPCGPVLLNLKTARPSSRSRPTR
jgi:hypothetical protein